MAQLPVNKLRNDKEVYQHYTCMTTGVCNCQAYQFNQPCWHRAASRLVRLHDEAREREFADRVVAVVEQSVGIMNEALDQAIAATHGALVTIPRAIRSTAMACAFSGRRLPR
jgi:hypothetical protein